MKFSQYVPTMQPNTINAQYKGVSDPMAFGDGGKGTQAMVGALGQVIKYEKDKQDDQDAADLMQARNDIMTSITGSLYGENGLMTTGVGQNAQGLTDRVTKDIQKTFEDISKNYNPRVQKALRGNLNENMASYQRLAAQQETREFNKQKESNYLSGLTMDGENIAANYHHGEIVDSWVNDALTLIHARAADQGWSGLQLESEKRSKMTAIMSGAIDQAIANDDFVGADTLLGTYGHMMSQEAVMKYKGQLNKEADIKMTREMGDMLLEKFPDDPEAARKYIFGDLANETITVSNGSGGTISSVDITGKPGADIAQRISDGIYEKHGKRIPADWILASMLLETDNMTSELAGMNNFGGVKGAGNESGHDGRGHSYFNSPDDYIAYMIKYYPLYEEDGIFKAKNMREFAAALKHGGYFEADLEKYQAGMESRLGSKGSVIGHGGGKGWDVDKGAGKYVGAKMDNGEVGCVEFVTKAGAAGGDKFLQSQLNKNVVSVPDLVRNAGDRVIPFDENKLTKGNIIIYGDNDHAVIYDEGYKYYGNSSGHKDQYGNKDPRVVHGSDYRQMDGLQPTKIIKTDGDGGESTYTKPKYTQKQLDNFWRQYEARLSDSRREKAMAKEKAKEDVQAQIMNTNSATEALAIVQEKQANRKDPDIINAAIYALNAKYPGAFAESKKANGTGGRSSKTKEKIDGVNGYWVSGGEWIPMEKFEEAEKLGDEYRYRLKLSQEGLDEIGSDQKKYNDAANLVNKVYRRNFTEIGLVSAKKALAEARWDSFKASHILMDKTGMTQDEAYRYINRIMEIQNSNNE